MVNKNIYPYVGTIVFIFGLSPLAYTIGINFSLLSLIVMILIATRINTIVKNNNFHLFLLIPLSFSLSFISFIYWGGDSIIIFLFPWFYLMSYLYTLGSDSEDIKIFTVMSSKVLTVFIIGAWFGFIYNLVGGQSLAGIELKGGNSELEFFLTTFSKRGGVASVIGVIRPTAIYDEPGAFAFIICVVALLRHKIQLDKKMTWFLLIGGMITFSLSLYIYILFYIFSLLKIDRKSVKILPIVIAIILIMSTFLPKLEFFDRLIINRFKVNKATGKLVGDNRSEAMELAINYIEPKMIFWGIDKLCIENVFECTYRYGRFGDNPVYPLVSFGILLSWIYYLILLMLFIQGLRGRSNIVYLGLLLLFLQRPYFLNLIYSFFVFYSIRAKDFLNEK